MRHLSYYVLVVIDGLQICEHLSIDQFLCCDYLTIVWHYEKRSTYQEKRVIDLSISPMEALHLR